MIFDRNTTRPMEWDWLKTYAQSLRDYHLHREGKFRGGDFGDRGTTTRRHVSPYIVRCIGKEADNLDEREAIGEGEDDAIEWSFFAENVRNLIEPIKAVVDQKIAKRRVKTRHETIRPGGSPPSPPAKGGAGAPLKLIHHAGVARTTLIAALTRKEVDIEALLKLAQAADELLEEHKAGLAQSADRLRRLKGARDKAGGRDKLASLLECDAPHLGRILNGKRPITNELWGKLISLGETTF